MKLSYFLLKCISHLLIKHENVEKNDCSVSQWHSDPPQLPWFLVSSGLKSVVKFLVPLFPDSLDSLSCGFYVEQTA